MAVRITMVGQGPSVNIGGEEAKIAARVLNLPLEFETWDCSDGHQRGDHVVRVPRETWLEAKAQLEQAGYRVVKL